MIEKHYQFKNILIKVDHSYTHIINNLKKFDTWKIQITVRISFIYPKENDDEECVMYSKSDNIINYQADEAFEKLFGSIRNRCQNNLER